MNTPELDAIIAEGAAAIPTTALWTEIKVALLAALPAATGSVVLGGPTGALATFTDINTVEFDVFYSIDHDDGIVAGNVGEITIEPVSATSFRVRNTGSDTSSLLRYRVFAR